MWSERADVGYESKACLTPLGWCLSTRLCHNSAPPQCSRARGYDGFARSFRSYNVALILCTTPTPTLCLAAILWMPCLPCCSAFAMAASIPAGMRGRPIGLQALN
jgi:hypothetical protein